MELIILLIVVGALAYAAWKYWPKPASADMKDAAGASEIAKIVEEAKQTADVNKDGKVDVADAVEVVKKVRKPRSKK